MSSQAVCCVHVMLSYLYQSFVHKAETKSVTMWDLQDFPTPAFMWQFNFFHLLFSLFQR